MQDILAGVLIGIAAGAVVFAIFCVRVKRSSRMLNHRDPHAPSSAAFVAADFPAPQRVPWEERAEFYGHQTFTY
ncbi:MAG TPA: hypothetical protein VFI82_02165 [Terriglobales bacterium]|jgi:hypothetical protein|nr:hypothetical protein [Terriglobales bacterium]